MSHWLTLKQMSEKYGISDTTIKYWLSAKYVTSSRIGHTLLIEEDSLLRYLDLHKQLGAGEEYLKKLLRDKRDECDFLLSKYDDEIYVLKTQRICSPLFKLVIREMAELVFYAGHRRLFYAISTGEPIERVARLHGIPYHRAVEFYESIVKELACKTGFLSVLRKELVNCRLRCADYKRQIESMGALLAACDMPKVDNGGFPADIVGLLGLPVREVVKDARARNALLRNELRTVKQVLEYALMNGWGSLLRLKSMAPASYAHIVKSFKAARLIDGRLNSYLYVHLSPQPSGDE